MNFEIVPHRGAGILQFGMTSGDIRAAMNVPFDSFFKSAASALPTDSFLDDSVHVFYRIPDRCEAIEFYSPSDVRLNSVKLLNVPYDGVKAFLARLDDQLEEDEDGFTSRALGIAIYCPPHRKSPDTQIESILVFEDGYYER